MEQQAREFILNIMDQASDLSLATIRPDGYPQATTVSFAHDGLTIYVGIGKHSQKADNISRNGKVSLTINNDYDDWRRIKGLSMAGMAEIVSDQEEIRRAGECLLKRYPQVADWAESGLEGEMAFLRIQPQVISMLDYEKGFGHTELVKA